MNRFKHLVRGYSPLTTDDSLSAPPASSPAAPAHATTARLSRALIAKSVAEALFVVALAVYFSYTHFNPYFRGSLDVADARTVEGWVVNEAAPNERVEVHLYIDGQFVNSRAADAPRADVLAAGRSRDAYHGFVFETPRLPPNKTYEARVYAMSVAGDGSRRVLQQIEGARQFRVTATSEQISEPEAGRESGVRR